MEETSRDNVRLETLEYIQAMLVELCAMARRERLDMVAYLTEMAYAEADETLRGQRAARAERGVNRGP